MIVVQLRQLVLSHLQQPGCNSEHGGSKEKYCRKKGTLNYKNNFNSLISLIIKQVQHVQ